MSQFRLDIKTCLFAFFLPVSFYNNQIISLGGQATNLSVYVKRTILIVPFTMSATCANELKQLDSLQKTDDSIKVIATPAVDFGSSSDKNVIQQFIDSLGLTITITQPMNVKKGDMQDALYRWLTNVSSNNHFDDNIDTAGKIFIVDDQGILYAITQPDIAMGMLTSLVYSNKTPNY